MQNLLVGFADYGYWGLFLASFLAATILPFSSEIVFTTLLYTIKCDAWTCIFAATIGNWLGGMTCYYLGRLGKMEWIEKYLRVSSQKVDLWGKKLQGKASWAAFFSFLPGVGDLIALAAGFLRANPYVTAVSMLLGKFVRYVVWVYVSYWVWM